jgi:hypothetical protein
MTHKIRCALAALALIVSGSASANVVNWGNIVAPDTRSFGNTFDSRDPEGYFTDYYNFSLTSGVNSFGGAWELDPLLNRTDISNLSVSLWSGGSSFGSFDMPTDFFGFPIEGLFKFEGLGAGNYSLHVRGNIDQHLGLNRDEAGYGGWISFTSATTAVPEPSTLAIMGLGLLGLAFAMRRRLFN